MPTHTELSLIIARMHFDAAFCERIYSGHRPSEIDEAQHQMLLAVDPRSFHCDPQRPHRLVQSLLLEAPVSSAIAGLDFVQHFCSSEHFHRAIMLRTYMIYAYLEWLESKAKDLARLERAIASARRRRSSPELGPQELVLAPHCLTLQVPEGILDRYQKAMQLLGKDPLAWLGQHQRLDPRQLGRVRKNPESLIVAQGSISRCSHGMAQLLTALREPCTLETLERRFSEELSRVELGEILRDLRDDGLVIGNTAP